MPRLTIADLQEKVESLSKQNDRLMQDINEYFIRMTNAELMADRMAAENGRLKERITELERQLSPHPQDTTGPIPRNPKRGRPFQITEDARERARSLRADGCSMRTIAKELGVSVSTIHGILNGP